MSSRKTPGRCPRGCEDCEPLHNVISDCGQTFVCCGRPDEFVHDDCFRHCFLSETADSMYDYNKLDMLDVIEVMVRSISTSQRLAFPKTNVMFDT